MKIVLTVNSIEKIFSQCAVCFLSEDIRPLKGTIGEVDWAMNGLITNLIRDGKLSGEFLESTLLRPDRFLACEKLLLLGMGPYYECHQKKTQILGKKLIHILTDLHVRDISLSFPVAEAGQSPDAFAENLTKGLLSEGDDKDIQASLEEMNLAISCGYERLDEALLGIQKAKVQLKKHFNVIVLEQNLDSGLNP